MSDTPAISRRSVLAGVSAAALLTGLGACSSSGGPEQVRFYLSKPEAIPYFNKLIATYNASQSDVSVILDSSSNLQAGFLRGNPPDLGLLNYNMEMSRFMERGALSDLGDMKEAARIKPELQKLIDQYATYPGRTSVLPYSVMAASVIYNKKIFAANNVTVPETWDAFLKVCDTLKRAGVLPFYATYADPWTIAQGWFDYTVGGTVNVADFYSQLQKEGTSVGAGSKVSFQKDLKDPVTKMKMLTDTYTNKDAASRGYGDGNLAFSKGQAAMYMQGPWAFGEIVKTATPGLDLGTFPLPMADSAQAQKVRVNVDLSAWIPEDSPRKDAARAFLSYLFQPKVMDAYNASQLGYGTTTDSAPVTDPRILGMKKYFDEARFYQGASQQIPPTIPAANYLQGIVAGADVTSTLRTLDADWARLALRQ